MKFILLPMGSKAIKIIESIKIGCCFTDINMPEMDGLELAEYIRKMDNTLPVVVMTGFPSLETHNPNTEKRCGRLSCQARQS